MTEKKQYKVLITETLQKTVLVEATSEQEPHTRGADGWKKAEYLLEAECFQGVEIRVVGEADGDNSEKELEHVDGKGGQADG